MKSSGCCCPKCGTPLFPAVMCKGLIFRCSKCRASLLVDVEADGSTRISSKPTIVGADADLSEQNTDTVGCPI